MKKISLCALSAFALIILANTQTETAGKKCNWGFKIGINGSNIRMKNGTNSLWNLLNYFAMRIYFLVLLLVIFQVTHSQTARGFYITLANDTVHTNYNLKNTFFKHYNIYEELPIVNDSAQTIKLKPTEIKAFFIDSDREKGMFTSMSINGKQTFLRIVALSPSLNIYEHTFWSDYGRNMAFALQKADSTLLYVEGHEGHTKFRKKIKGFFAGNDHILAAMEKLFVRPGLVGLDMPVFVKRIINKINATYIDVIERK